MNILENCMLCPRKCGVNRNITRGFCGAGAEIIAAKACLHMWEEPCISWKNGAGTVFFSGCSLHCRFCQNNEISNELHGMKITSHQLADIFLRLRDNGADNIELVTPAHFVPQIIEALDMVKSRLDVPVIYNSGGYELPDTIRMLDGYIDIYLPDLKYYSSDASARYSNASDYFERASEAILLMIKQVGKLRYNEEGGLLSGTVIRHLVLPGLRHDSMKILDWIAENTSSEDVLVSIMNQYTPFDFISDEFKEIKRHVTKMEYNSVVKHAQKLGICGFTQDKASASEKFVPGFDLSGLIGK